MPLTHPRGAARRRGRGADAERHARRCASRRAPAHGTVQRLRGEGPPKLGSAQGRRRHPLPLRDRRARQAHRRAGEGRRRAVARRSSGDPRARLFANGAGAPPATRKRAARDERGDGVGTASPRRRDRRRSTRVEVATDRGVFMISVAAELANMHPQTLRMYEARGLIEPKRSPKGTRLYSQDDVERLRRIQEMTAELGLQPRRRRARARPRARDRRDARAHRGARARRRCTPRCGSPRSSSGCGARSAPSSSRTAASSELVRAADARSPFRLRPRQKTGTGGRCRLTASRSSPRRRWPPPRGSAQERAQPAGDARCTCSRVLLGADAPPTASDPALSGGAGGVVLPVLAKLGVDLPRCAPRSTRALEAAAQARRRRPRPMRTQPSADF